MPASALRSLPKNTMTAKRSRHRRRSFNHKRRIASDPIQADLDRLARSVIYSGNAAHKRNPGDFGLAPPLGPRPGKTLCDDAGLFSRAVAQELLREGIRIGLVSDQVGGGYPQNVWAVSAEGIPLEAQYGNDGSYHGYPMPIEDAFREKVIKKWKAAHDR